MARVGTALGNLGTWQQGENPGGGSQVADSNLLNGNWYKLDVGVFTEHGTDGTHNNDVIDGPNLKTTVCDGTSIQLTGAPLELSIKDLGVTSGKIAANAVIAGKIADGGVNTAAKIAAGIVGPTQLATSAVETAKINDDAVTAPKISHDNKRTKVCFVFAFPTDAGGYGYAAGTICTASLGVPMPQAGSITRISVCNDSGSVSSANSAYGTDTFSQGDKLTVWLETAAADTYEARINDVNLLEIERGGNSAMVTVEVEFDD
jgi:hypothetical protein